MRIPIRQYLPVPGIRGVLWGVLCLAFLAGILLGARPIATSGEQDAAIRGLWVWKGPSILEVPRGTEALRDFCESQGINEIYISVSEGGREADDALLVHLIDVLHRSDIRVEALLSSEDADEPGKHREKLLDHVRAILQFNQDHPRSRFDGIHLDIEPQQRPENKGAGNLSFLPDLVNAYRDVRALAQPAHLTVNADIQNKLLKGDSTQRKMLLSSLPYLTLMLYELSSPNDGESVEQKTDKLRAESQKYLDMAYDGLNEPDLARLIIGLRTPDYEDLLPKMLESLDTANHSNSHYAGWARHSYNDSLQPPN